MGNIFGYIRVSSRDQNEDRQLIALKELAIPEKNIFIDKQSGKDFKRPQYRKMIRRVRKDDLLYIKSIDPDDGRLTGALWSVTCICRQRQSEMAAGDRETHGNRWRKSN